MCITIIWKNGLLNIEVIDFCIKMIVLNNEACIYFYFFKYWISSCGCRKWENISISLLSLSLDQLSLATHCLLFWVQSHKLRLWAFKNIYILNLSHLNCCLPLAEMEEQDLRWRVPLKHYEISGWYMLK